MFGDTVKEIESRNNKIIKYVLRLNSSSSFRKKERAFFCEGARLCDDAIKSGVDIQSAFFTSSASEKYSDLYRSLSKANVEIYSLSDTLFKLITDTQSPQGVAVVCKMQNLSKLSLSFKKAIALECVQDPQNMGTILRSAEAFGIDCVIMSKDCCDIFSPKVLRGSMGAVFRQKIIIPDNFYEAIASMNDNGIKTYAAVPRAGENILSANFSTSCCVLIGNEGNGLTDRAIDLCSGKITIQMNGNAESLNAAVASSVVMWEMVRGVSNE